MTNTEVETPYGKRTINTETTARDELFPRELGITLARGNVSPLWNFQGTYCDLQRWLELLNHVLINKWISFFYRPAINACSLMCFWGQFGA